MKKIVGIFAASFEAMKAIDSLKQDGIDNEHIWVIANDDWKSDTIEEKTNVTVKDDIYHPAEQQHTLDEKFKLFLTKEAGAKKNLEFLSDLGLTAADTDRYVNEVEIGNILVLVDSDSDFEITGLLSTKNIHLNNIVDVKPHSEKIDNFTIADQFKREENSHKNEKHSGRPKERSAYMELGEMKREYEEEVNPFENRYLTSYSNTLEDD